MRKILLFAIGISLPAVLSNAAGIYPAPADSVAASIPSVSANDSASVGSLQNNPDVQDKSRSLALAADSTMSEGMTDGAVAADSVDTSQWPVFDKPEEASVVTAKIDSSFNETLYYRGRKPDADKAVWFSAVLPGLGQIYNRQYWKLPIIYGGALGIAYAITWNNQMYVDYRKAYLDLIDSDPDTRSYENLLPEGTVIDDSNRSTYERTFQNGQETYLRYRDLSIIVAGVLYILTMVDAYVDAQLFDYDISPDLSVNVSPAIIPSSTQEPLDASVGVKCKVRF